ncbi:hypothetical protein NZNM25_18110 [Nitrosopumilus zosterae]|uniref:Uncharacterized protein n=1 Tax=Nitrosopumilus zosterae TaxID=718286 RepID=A0A2S2KTM3_9ARCH|nr:hypothetical protein [Nitrosopumilus zosterae]BDQ31935.1 hypothetical protein NZOSNM25_002077 [Nitrosopumilus zosterae]GBH35020.1 hypothetical protein NZNM25_18110 [Nitrosopumilus zosterae]
MNTIVTFGLLILVASMALGGITNSIYAQDDPSILLKLAKRAQNQIQNQISSESPDEIKRLFEEGIQNVNYLEKAIRNNDTVSAKEHFLSAMKIFTEISRHLSTSDDAAAKSSRDISEETPTNPARSTAKDPSNDIQRLQVYVNNLKSLAEKYETSIDFSELDKLFELSRQQISDNQFSLASETLQKIQEIVVEINKEIREEAAKQESQRAKEYAQQYLEQLDRLIENAKKQGLSDEIINKLENARENLSSADNPADIVQEIRKILSIKKQFELTKNDRLESRVLQIEKTISQLSQIDGVDHDILVDAKETLQTIKRYLYDGEFDNANQLLRDLAKQLEEIKNSL